nr:uncharacterized protein LOC112313486 isoform X2 [Desmodus rotundus]
MMYLPGTLPAQWRPNEDSVPRFLPSPQRVGAEKGLLSFFLSVHVTTPLLVQHLKGLCQHHWEKCPPQRKGDRPRFPEMEMPAHVGPAEAQAPVTFGDLAIYFSLEECGRLAPCRRICTKTSCWRTTSTWSLSSSKLLLC